MFDIPLFGLKTLFLGFYQVFDSFPTRCPCFCPLLQNCRELDETWSTLFKTVATLFKTCSNFWKLFNTFWKLFQIFFPDQKISVTLWQKISSCEKILWQQKHKRRTIRTKVKLNNELSKKFATEKQKHRNQKQKLRKVQKHPIYTIHGTPLPFFHTFRTFTFSKTETGKNKNQKSKTQHTTCSCYAICKSCFTV